MAIKTIDELSIGDFVKVNQTDGPVVDRLNFSGKVIRLSRTDGRMEIQTIEGIIGIGFTMDDIDVDITKLKQRPKGWKEFKKNPVKKKEEELPTIKTKRDQVYDLVRDNPRKKTGTLIKLAQREVGGTVNLVENYVRIALIKLGRDY